MRDASVGEPTGPSKHSYDVVIVGSGMGGGTLAYALADSGVDVLLIERGDFLPQEKQNWSPQEVFEGHRYANAEQWYDTEGRPFSPGTYYYVGGNTKLYGSSLVRFRREDFQSTQHEAGESPEWPFSYDDFAPYYARAEQVYRVHGDHTDDPTLPRDEPFPYPAIGHEPPVQEAADACAASDTPRRTFRWASTCARAAAAFDVGPATGSPVACLPSPMRTCAACVPPWPPARWNC